jgi:A/G-specific adenine glycosylase
MLQQTTVATVRPRFERFMARWPTIEALAAAPLDEVIGEWAGLGYYARARNLHRAAGEIVARRGAVIPSTEEELIRLPGFGPYTAAAVAAIAFGRPAVVVDGNVERVAARFFGVETPPPALKREVAARLGALIPADRPGHFAEAMMDLGATICTPRAPRCAACPLAEQCAARRLGAPERFPARKPRPPRPERRGLAYALVNEAGEVLFERRPPKGLLGGLLSLPTSQWTEAAPRPAPPARARWRAAGRVRHVFTHFALELDVLIARAPKGFEPGARAFLPPADAALPTVMRKALDAALGAGPGA